MNVRTAAGWTALSAGALLLIGSLGCSVAGSASPGGIGVFGGAFPGMRGPGGMMGPGMMGWGGSGTTSAGAIAGAPEVKVEASNFTFTPNEIRLPKGIEVNLTLANAPATGVVHDLTVPTLGIHIVASAGETRTIGLRGLAAGRYDAYCGVAGHAQAGMRATVIVE